MLFRSVANLGLVVGFDAHADHRLRAPKLLANRPKNICSEWAGPDLSCRAISGLSWGVVLSVIMGIIGKVELVHKVATTVFHPLAETSSALLGIGLVVMLFDGGNGGIHTLGDVLGGPALVEHPRLSSL